MVEVFACADCGTVTADVYWDRPSGKRWGKEPVCATCFEQRIRRWAREQVYDEVTHRDGTRTRSTLSDRDREAIETRKRQEKQRGKRRDSAA